MLPVDPSTPAVDPFYDAVLPHWRRPPSSGWFGLLFLIVVLAVTGASMMSAVALLFAVLFRDAVRWGVMLATRTFDSRLLALPLSREALPVGTTPGREAAVVLSGPAFLVAWSLVTFIVGRVTGSPFANALSLSAVGLAAFTLLPLKPYDGWRLLNLALFSRSVKLELAVGVLTSLLLVALGVVLQAWVIVGFAVLNVLTSRRLLLVERAAAAFRASGVEVTSDTLPDGSVKALYAAVCAVFGDFPPRAEPQARLCAQTMREVHARAVRVHPTAGVTVLLLLIYGALITYFVIGLAVAAQLSAGAGTPGV